MMPSFQYEEPYYHDNKLVAGVDEVGRGPWAGPVVAAAVILNKHSVPQGIKDSKKLSRQKREWISQQIEIHAMSSIGIATVEEIDALNILGATKLAMQRAVLGLKMPPDVALIDGNQCPLLSCKMEALVKGDQYSLSIAAASIVAKVFRDRWMQTLASEYPMYGWEQNAGYGTKQHQLALKTHGITKHHRRSFAPIRALID